MDVIISAIIVGFLTSVILGAVFSFFKGFRKFKAQELEKRHKEMTVVLRVDEVEFAGEKLFLVFDYPNNKFLTQGSVTDVKQYIDSKLSRKNVFLLSDDGETMALLKSAEIS